MEWPEEFVLLEPFPCVLQRREMLLTPIAMQAKVLHDMKNTRQLLHACGRTDYVRARGMRPMFTPEGNNRTFNVLDCLVNTLLVGTGAHQLIKTATLGQQAIMQKNSFSRF